MEKKPGESSVKGPLCEKRDEQMMLQKVRVREREEGERDRQREEERERER